MALYCRRNHFETYENKYESIDDDDFRLLKGKLPESHTRGVLLDLACGSGIMGERLKSDFPHIVSIGTDISFPLLKWSVIPVCQSDAHQLPFKNQSFDIVAAAAAFHHFDGFDRALDECARCLKPGGFFLAFDPNKFHPQRLAMMTNPLRHVFYKSGDRAISPVKFKNTLKRKGFENISIEYIALKGRKLGFSGLNYLVFNMLSDLRLAWLVPIIAPWFVITANRPDTGERG